MKKRLAVYRKPTVQIRDHKMVDEIVEVPVRIMAEAEGYAMVRRSDVRAGMVFAVSVKDLRPIKSVRQARSVGSEATLQNNNETP